MTMNESIHECVQETWQRTGQIFMWEEEEGRRKVQT